MDAMPDSDVLQTREALLVKAAQAWADDSALDPAVLGEGDSVLCYLRATNLRLGLLINFNDYTLVKGVKRVIRS